MLVLISMSQYVIRLLKTKVSSDISMFFVNDTVKDTEKMNKGKIKFKEINLQVHRKLHIKYVIRTDRRVLLKDRF